MSFGFKIVSGSGSTVEINSDNDAVGVYLDRFFVAYNTTVTKSYPSFYGSAIYTIIIQADATRANIALTSINNTTKTVSVTSTPSAAPARQTGVWVTVLGK